MLDLKTVALTLLALIAFASNSLLTRLALGAREVDAATFTTLRLSSGALVLALLLRLRTGSWTTLHGTRASSRAWTGPLALFAYAAPFSFAYLRIGAAVGALVLFGVVQLTMIGYAIVRGERPSALSWLGIALACLGMGVLTVPAAARPDLVGLLLMTLAGIAWAVYSLLGRTLPDPLAANARSFLWSCPLALALSALLHESAFVSARGGALALLSGGLTSGLGYAIWYQALPRLSVTQAAVAQLAVPVLAALGAAWLLAEQLSARLLLAVLAVVSGVGIVLSARARR